MSFEVGHKKLGGRKRGMPNKFTSSIKEAIAAFLEEELLSLPNTFKEIKSPEKRLELLIKLLPFVVPKAQEISLDLLPDSKLDSLIETLKNDEE
jgi:hypothetical protein